MCLKSSTKILFSRIFSVGYLSFLYSLGVSRIGQKVSSILSYSTHPPNYTSLFYPYNRGHSCTTCKTIIRYEWDNNVCVCINIIFFYLFTYKVYFYPKLDMRISVCLFVRLSWSDYPPPWILKRTGLESSCGIASS